MAGLSAKGSGLLAPATAWEEEDGRKEVRGVKKGMNLRIPGPTPLAPEVRRAMSMEMMDHRGLEFERLMCESTLHLRHFYQTEGEVLLLTASGTGGLEAALVNTLSPGDVVLAVTNGAFGERWAAMARAFGADVRVLDYPWGTALDALDIEQALRGNPDVRVLLTTHNETSTGVLNDLAQVAEMLRGLRGERPLWLVDAVSSLGAVDLPMDAWGCDMVVSASQKAWMAPPGLAFVGVSARAWERMLVARCPRYYWDLMAAKKQAQRGQTPFTPALPAIYGLCTALRSMAKEGLPAIVARHRRLCQQLRAGLRALGLRLLADDACASPTVTAVHMPSGVSAGEVKSEMARRGVIVASGMGAFKDELLRIAHLGYCKATDLEQVLDALQAALVCAGAAEGRAI